MGDKDNIRFTEENNFRNSRNSVTIQMLKMSFEKGINSLEKQVKKIS